MKHLVIFVGLVTQQEWMTLRSLRDCCLGSCHRLSLHMDSWSQERQGGAGPEEVQYC